VIRYPLALIIASVVTAPALASKPVTLPLPEGGSKPLQPQVAVAGPKDIYVTFGSEKVIYCTASHDGGGHFEKPVKVASVPSLMLGKRRGPRIVAVPDALVIAAIGQGGELLSWRSSDRGRSWLGPVTINDVPKAAREGLHALAAGPKGEMHCVWLDLRNERPEVFGSGSTDGGKTWSQNLRIYSSPAGNVCECCHPSVTFDSHGNLYVMWRNWLGGNRDLYLSVSKDGGRMFSEAQQLGVGHWRLDNCPMDGGAVAVQKPGEVATVWRRQKEVFATLPGQREEIRLGPGEQPWVAADHRGIWMTWISRDGGDLSLRRPKHQQSEVIAHQAADPVIAAPSNGTGPVVLAWESGQDRRACLAVLVIPTASTP
jgi:hypothetical protein